MKKDFMRAFEELLNNPETDKKELVAMLYKILDQLTKEERKASEIKPLGSQFLRDLMRALIDGRWDEAKTMENKLEEFLKHGDAKDREYFAMCLYNEMRDWARNLRTFYRLRAVLSKLLEDKFKEYEDWIDGLRKTMDRLYDAMDRVYRNCDCDC